MPGESISSSKAQRSRDAMEREIRLTQNVVLAQRLLDDCIVGDGDPLSVDLGVSTLVHQFTDSLEVGLSVRDIWLDELEHVLGGLGHSDKDTVVDLEETEELEDFAGFGGEFGDTERRALARRPGDGQNQCLDGRIAREMGRMMGCVDGSRYRARSLGLTP